MADMSIPVDLAKAAEDIARAMVADIMESWSPEEIRRLIEQMEAKLRKPH
jgi:hypothetical protein